MRIRAGAALVPVLVLLCWAVASGATRGEATRWLTLARAESGQTPVLDRATEVVVRGNNASSGIVAAWLRIDDERSSGYAERVNEPLALPPGDFEVQRSLSALRTPSGRALDLGGRLRLQLFTGTGGASVSIGSLRLEPGPALPPGATGWDFGSAAAPLFPGFMPVAPDSPLIVQGAGTRGVLRPAGDALVGDGIRGLSALRLPLAPGKWRISLWINDSGEWEYLPHFLERRILVNGQPVLEERRDPGAWVREVYLGNADHEAAAADLPWTSVATRVNQPLTIEAESVNGTVEIRFAGRDPDSRFVAAVLAEPAGGQALEALQALRSKRFDARWPRARPPEARGGQDLSLRCRAASSSSAGSETACTRVLGAPGSMLSVDFELQADAVRGPVSISLQAAETAMAGIDAVLRYGHWAFRRSAGMLVLNDDRLRALGPTVGVPAGLPRRINLQLFIAQDAPAGRHRLELRLQHANSRLTMPVDIEVLPVALPSARAPAGVFYETLPFLGWFGELAAQRTQAMACDYALLGRMGLRAIAPSLREALPARVTDTVSDLSVANAAGFSEPLIAYTPLRRSLARAGQARTLAVLRELESELARSAMSAPVWIVADEPGDTPAAQSGLVELVHTLRASSPRARLGAFLNSPGSRMLADRLDLAIVNHGYGIDPREIERRLDSGRHTWLYNLPEARSAAGLLLWHSGAQGYLQWHAHMPTADPFDPTDGREGDYLLIYPAADPCPAVPDIDSRLLDLALGVVDQRWLQWLESRAQDDGTARALLGRIRESLASGFRPGDPVPGDAMAANWQREISAYAAGPGVTVVRR